MMRSWLARGSTSPPMMRPAEVVVGGEAATPPDPAGPAAAPGGAGGGAGAREGGPAAEPDVSCGAVVDGEDLAARRVDERAHLGVPGLVVFGAAGHQADRKDGEPDPGRDYLGQRGEESPVRAASPGSEAAEPVMQRSEEH